MKNSIKYILLVAILAVGYYFTNSYTKNIEAEADLQNATNIALQETIQGMKVQVEYVNSSIANYQSLSNIIPTDFTWTNIIRQIEIIETKLGMESAKDYYQVSKDAYTEFEGLDEKISLYLVVLDTTVDQNTMNALLNQFYEIDQLIIVNYIDFALEDGLIDVEIELLYFIYE